MRSWTRVLLLAVTLVVVVTTQPAAAANATASEHTTFGTGSSGEPSPASLTNAEIQGSGTSASVVATESSYNPVDAEGDGATDGDIGLVGDDGADNGVGSELRVQPTQDATIDEITVNISNVRGSDYGFTTDVYIIQEQPDGTAAEGTKVATWDPDFSTGYQTIDLSTSYAVTAGQDYSIQFTAPGSDNFGDNDAVEIATDNSASSAWMTDEDGTAIQRYADVSINATVDSAQYTGAAHSASEVVAGEVDLTLSDADATVEWQEDGDGDGNWNTVSTATYSTSGTKSQSLSGTSANKWRAVVDFAATGSSPTAELDAERVLYDNDAPSLSDPTPTGNISTYGGQISVNVSDADFSTVQGDSVTVTAENTQTSTQIGSTTVGSDQTVSFTYDAVGGANNITWTATDDAGASDTIDQDFIAPEKLLILNQTDPNHAKVTTSTDLEVQFYNGDEVIERTTTDGTVSLGGLPASDEIVVTVDPDGYYARRVIIDSLFEQQKVYVLPENASSVENRFVLNDNSGQFPDEDTRIRIQRPITNSTSGNTTYQELAGDQLGAAGEFVTTLEEDVRYRITLENTKTGDTRVIGAYTATRTGTVELEVATVSFPEPDGNAVGYSADRVEPATTAYAIVKYNDTQTTDDLDIVIHERNNESNEVFNQSYTDVSTLYLNETLPDNSTEYVVDFDAENGGNATLQATVPLVSNYGVGIPIAAPWLGSISLVVIVFATSLYQARLAAFGALVCVFIAGAMMLLQWITINPFAWWGAAAIATIGYITAGRGVAP